MVRVRVSTPCHPTESLEEVKAAVGNLFPDLRIEPTEGRLVGVTDRLDRLRELIRNQRIRDTARRQLRAGQRGTGTTVSLSKQAASAGVVSFAADSPLGDVLVEIESDDLSATIDFVAESTRGPRTQDARPQRVQVKRPS